MKKLIIIAIALSFALPVYAEDRHAEVSGDVGGGGSQVVDNGSPETPSESRGGGGGGLSKAEKLERAQLRQYLELLQIYYQLLLIQAGQIY